MSSKNFNNDLDLLETQVAIYFSELLKTNDEIIIFDEVDLEQGHVSWVSPISKALIKARIGDCVRIQTPTGPTEIEILNVEYRA